MLSRGLDSVHTTGENTACLHDATSAFYHEDNKVTNKEILERIRLPSMDGLLIRKNLRWNGHLRRMYPDRLPKLLSQLPYGHRKSPVQGYHKEKPEAYSHKDRLMDITRTAER